MEIVPFISFIMGITSVFSPCILPILPIFAAVSLKSKSKSETASFICGILSIFVVIVVLTGFFTSFVYRYIVHVRLLSAIFLFAIGILMLLGFSISFKPVQIKKDVHFETFVMGFLTSLAWVPCYSPYLISLISLLAGLEDVFGAVFNMALYSLGFAFTLFALSYIISGVDVEKIISKTKYIPKIFAVLIIVGSIYLFLNSLGII